jgi:isopropylmalate/homocitrate/citramalate synthase
MTDLPAAVEIREEGPREGFQIEPGPIPTSRKVELINALAATGLKQIQVCSLVSPKLVPGWADADAVLAAIAPPPGVAFTALWFNAKGFERALAFRATLKLYGSISFAASEAFSRKNLNRDRAGQVEAMRALTTTHQEAGVPVTRIAIQAAFGCNYAGDVAPALVVQAVADGMAIAAEAGATITEITLADTMGWGTPIRIERGVGAVRDRWPDAPIALHLHDTRGLGIANAAAGLRLGVTRYDTTVGGLGGCPFAGQHGAPGNICTEELVLLCEEMGIATGVNLDALIEAGHLAEAIVGHRLPSELLRSGTLEVFRRRVA